MSITTYSELKTAIANFSNRTDLTSYIDDFIDLCESEMQVDCKLVEFEGDTTLTVTAGVATIPSGWLGARSVIWQSNPERTLRYVPPDRLEQILASNEPGVANYYTVTGTQMRFADHADGTAQVIYHAKFTPLSDSNTSNGILSEYPGAYLYGSLKHLAVFMRDAEGATGYQALFDGVVGRIKRNNSERKYAGVTLEVRPA